MVLVKINYASVSPIIKITYDETPVYIKTSVNNVYAKVVYGTSIKWGDIEGTLSDQTDLQNALDDKVPYTGATANVDLGEYELKAGQLTLDVSPTGTASVGTTRWNNTIGSSETTLKGGSVVLKNGVDLVARIVNKVTPNTTLTKAAYQAVRISGAQGQRLAVAFAQANNDNNSADTIGLVTETIATNQEGFIMTVGSLEGINTTGSLQGETWSDGDVLYLSPTVAGAITNIKPVAPQHLVVIGYVEYAHQNNGKIYVKIMNGWELGELHDVNTNGATNGQVLTYNGSIWVPSTNGVGTVTSVDMTVPTGLTVSGNPITSSGTLALGLASGYSIPTDANQTNWTAAYNDKINSAAVTGTTTKTLTLNQQDGGTITASWTDYDTAPVTSVFGRTGAVVATSGDYTTDQVTEGTNLYFTDARARAAISLTTTGTSGAATYVGGVLNIPQYQAALTNPITGTGASGQIAYWSGTNTQTGSATLTYSPTSSLLVNNSVTAATAVARGTNLTPTLVAAANNDVLVGLDVNPTFTNGAFTGVINYGIRNTSKTTLGDFLTITGGGNTPTGLGNGIHISYNPTSNIGWIQSLQIGTAGRQLNIMGYPLYLGSSQSGTLHVQLSTSGNLLLQNGGTFTDGGQRLQVTGTSYFSDSVGIGATFLTGYNLRIAKNITGGVNSLGVSVDSAIQSDVTNTAQIIASSPSVQNTAFTLAQLRHFVANPSSSFGSATVTNQYGFYAENTMTGATNNYAFYGRIASSANRWNIYMEGTANNYMAGSLGIGTTSLTGNNLKISKNLTGATSGYSIDNTTTVLSDVTSSAIYYNTYVNTQNANFSLANIVHYQAGGISTFANVTAGGAVTNQVGFYVLSSTIGATFNYGFRGSIPSGTNRWNLYMDGTASNYLEGDTAIGTTTIGTATKFTLGGSETAVSAIARGQLINTTLTASANNDVMVGLDINPTFTNGAFTGVKNYAIRYGSFNIDNGFNVNTTGSVIISGDFYGGAFRGNYIGNSSGTNYVRVFSNNGNVLLQNGGTFTDAGYRLDVNGTARVRGATVISGSTTTGNGLQISTGVTTSGGIGHLLNIYGTLTASANNDILNGITIAPTWSVGAFTGTVQNAIQASGNIKITSIGSVNWRYIIGNSTTAFLTSNYEGGLYGTTDATLPYPYNSNGHVVLQGRSSGDRDILIVNGATPTVQAVFFGSSKNVAIGQSSDSGFRLDVAGTLRAQNDFTLSDSRNIIVGNTTGTKIGTATSQKLAFWNATPIVQPTTAVASAAFVANTGTAVNDASTFDGYTMAQIVKALRNAGLLA